MRRSSRKLGFGRHPGAYLLHVYRRILFFFNLEDSIHYTASLQECPISAILNAPLSCHNPAREGRATAGPSLQFESRGRWSCGLMPPGHNAYPAYTRGSGPPN